MPSTAYKAAKARASPARSPLTMTYVRDKRKAWSQKEPLPPTCREETASVTYSTKLVCPIQRTMAMIADKWKVIVIANLGDGTKRFRELQRAMAGVTPKVLTRQLRDLEHDGLVSRVAYAEIPPRVEYSLTPLGRSL